MIDPAAPVRSAPATATVTAPTTVREGRDATIPITLTLKNAGDAGGTVTMSFVSAQSTATNNSDVVVPSYSHSFTVSQSPAQDYVLPLPTVSVIDDNLFEPTEIVAINIKVTGQTFDNGTDNVTLLINLESNEYYGDQGTNPNDVLTGSDWNDNIFGLTGNDRLIPGKGDDIVDGGSGIDTVVLSGLHSAYQFGGNGDALVLSGPDGRDTLKSIEYAQFDDGIYAFPTDLAPTQFYRVDGEKLANSSLNLDQKSSEAIVLSNGNYLVVWTDQGGETGTGASFAVKGQILSATGIKIGAEFIVNSTSAGDQTGPQAAALPSGGFVVTWTDSSGTGGDALGTSIKARIFSASGDPLGNEFLVNTITQGAQYSPTVTPLANGGFVIGWGDPPVSGTSQPSRIHSQAFTATGQKIGLESSISGPDPGSGFAGNVVLNPLASGGFVLAWQTTDRISDSSTAQWTTFDSAGQQTSAISSAALGRHAVSFSVIVLANQDLVLTHSNAGTVNAQIYHLDGSKVGSFFVEADAGTSSSAPSADPTPDGGFLVTWTRSAGNDVAGQFFDSSGNALSGRFDVNSVRPGNQTLSDAAVRSDGSFLVTWTDNSGIGGDASGSAVKFQAFTPTPESNHPTSYLASNGFGAAPGAGGWSSFNTYPRIMADVNQDGRADIIAFGEGGTYVSLQTEAGSFATPIPASSQFGVAGGWTSFDLYPREAADVNGDGKTDLIAFADNGTFVALGNGDGTFAAAKLAHSGFGAGAAAGGWNSFDHYPRLVADVNGDGRADIVAFGENATYVALGRTDGTFTPPDSIGAVFTATTEFRSGAGTGGGWSSYELYPRLVGDVNGDGRADLVGFGAAGTYVALGNPDGTFAAAFLATDRFGAGAASGGWNSFDHYPRILADMNGDGGKDIVAFGESGVYYSLASADGHFGAPQLATSDFRASPGSGGGWTSFNLYPRQVVDVNGDHRADIVGFGEGGAFVFDDVFHTAPAAAAASAKPGTTAFFAPAAGDAAMTQSLQSLAPDFSVARAGVFEGPGAAHNLTLGDFVGHPDLLPSNDMPVSALWF